MNVVTFFITFLFASQAYASCATYSVDSTQCTSAITTSHTSTSIGFAVGGAIIILLALINIGIVCKRHRRLRQRATPNRILRNSTQSQYPPGSLQSVPGQTNLLNRQGVTVAPSFPQPSYPFLLIHSAHTRSTTYSNQTPHGLPPFSSNSTRLGPPGFSLPSPPSMFSRVSADSSTVQTPSISVTPAAHTPPHTTLVGRPSPPDNIEMRPLAVNMEVANDEPPPAYTLN